MILAITHTAFMKALTVDGKVYIPVAKLPSRLTSDLVAIVHVDQVVAKTKLLGYAQDAVLGDKVYRGKFMVFQKTSKAVTKKVPAAANSKRFWYLPKEVLVI